MRKSALPSSPFISLLAGCLLALVLSSALRWGADALSAPPPPPIRLTSLYEKIQAGTVDLGRKREWPDKAARAAMQRGLERVGGRVTPRTFTDGNGPLDVAIFWNHRPEVVAMIEEAQREVFTPFVAAVLDAVAAASSTSTTTTTNSAQRVSEVEQGVAMTSLEALHTVVLVFSEHPSLLDDAQLPGWKAVDDDAVRSLGSALQSDVFTDEGLRLRLRVWGYCVTGDGSMLLLLEDLADQEADHPAEQSSRRKRKGGSGRVDSFMDLRSRIHATGSRVLGSLNSRPKALIHVTCGRFLAWPGDGGDGGGDGLSEAEQEQEASRVGRVVEEWGEAFAQGHFPASHLPPFYTQQAFYPENYPPFYQTR